MVCVRPRHGIVAVAAPGVAAADAVDREIAALDAAVAFQRLERVGRTGGLEAAAVADPGRQDQAIGAHREGEEAREGGHFARA